MAMQRAVKRGITAKTLRLRDAHRVVFDKLAEKLQISTYDDWYQHTMKEVVKIGGHEVSSVLHGYRSCLHDALRHIYPECDWKAWKWKKCPKFARTKEGIVEQVEWIATQLHIRKLEDWYKVTVQDLKNANGWGMVQKYNGSLYKILQEVYPDFKWQFWKFYHSPMNSWLNPQNQREYFEWLSQKLNIIRPQDWNRVSIPDIEALGGNRLISCMGGIERMINTLCPEAKISNKYSLGKSQAAVCKILKDHFPNEEMIVEYKHPNMRFAGTNELMELDVFFPRLALAFEYQGKFHFEYTFVGSQDARTEKDQQKRQACSANGITLIEIPFWWDRQKDSILATIHKYRPDLVPFATGTPIPDEPEPGWNSKKVNMKRKKANKAETVQ